MKETMQAVRDSVGSAWRVLGGRTRLVDVTLVVVLLLWVLGSSGPNGAEPFVLGVLQVVPLLWRRSHPLPVALAVAAACLLQVFLNTGPLASNITVPIVVYSAAAFGSRRHSQVVLGMGIIGAVVAALAWSRIPYDPAQYFTLVVFQFAFMAVFVGVSWVLGDVVRRRTAVIARLTEQNRALARDQAQRTRLAAQDERASIAREMHDVVAHSLAVVVVQADGGLYAARQALEREPGMAADRAALERAAATLSTLAETARTSLADTRTLVGVLREPGSGADYSPLQGIAHLDDLVQRVRDSGVPVEAHVRGTVDDLPQAVDLAAYRVVQESLTNAMKHAGPSASVDVDLLRTPAVLLVRVTDDGLGAASATDDDAGHGIIGMAERVEVLGGSVHTGPRRTGGWEVVATIPVSGQGTGHDSSSPVDRTATGTRTTGEQQ
ncbi:sensor histidine kinase [Ornithinimicrobium sp. LYQ92]|uniref:sensor histidine kinase n=1 Tax=Serinicoccus sp. LYQ92 TaxID=3378798 RepID=UPI00385479D3